MKSKIIIYLITILSLLLCVLFVSEVVSFIGLFIGLITTMSVFIIKGILLNKIYYSLLLLSFFSFFLYLFTKKAKLFLLYFSLLVFITGLSIKFFDNNINRDLFFIIKKSNSSDNILLNNSINTLSNTITNKGYDTMNLNSKLQKSRLEEQFDTFSSSQWIIQDYSFIENGCEMSRSQVLFNKSTLSLTVELNIGNKLKPYKGGEIGSVSLFLYGIFTVRMKNQIAPGTVSSFFLMNKWYPKNWEHKEIDIEFLGKNSNTVQFTIHHYKEGGKNHVFKAFTYSLEFDSSLDFHDYSILWTKDSISWLVDDKLVHTEKDILIDEEMNIRLNHWAADPLNKDFVNWLGKIEVKKLPSIVYYDYVKYFPLP